MLHFEKPAKVVEIEFFEDEVCCGQGWLRAIDKLDEAAPTLMIG